MSTSSASDDQCLTLATTHTAGAVSTQTKRPRSSDSDLRFQQSPMKDEVYAVVQTRGQKVNAAEQQQQRDRNPMIHECMAVMMSQQDMLRKRALAFKEHAERCRPGEFEFTKVACEQQVSAGVAELWRGFGCGWGAPN